MIPRPNLAGVQPTRALAQSMLARHPWRTPAVVFAAYLAAILVGDSLRDPASGVSLFWLPNAVLVAVLVLLPARAWAPVLAAGIAAEVLGDAVVGIGPIAALALGVMNAGEATVVAAAIAWADRDPWPLRSVRSVLVVATVAVCLTAATALLGAVVAARVFTHSWIAEYPTWWLGDSLGILVGFPVAVAALGQLVVRGRAGLQRWAVALGLGAVGVLVGLGVADVANPSSAVDRGGQRHGPAGCM